MWTWCSFIVPPHSQIREQSSQRDHSSVQDVVVLYLKPPPLIYLCALPLSRDQLLERIFGDATHR